MEHLISIGNTELTGLYIFWRMPDTRTPYKIAGAKGDLLNCWLNKNSGLAGGDNSIGMELSNLAAGTYAVSTAVLGAGELTLPPQAEGTLATVVAEYLHGPRAGFFGSGDIFLDTEGSSGDISGSLALEIVEDVRYEDLTEEQQGKLKVRKMIVLFDWSPYISMI